MYLQSVVKDNFMIYENGILSITIDDKHANTKNVPEAYETLLLDVFLGNQNFFIRDDEIEAAWSVVMPIIQSWENITPHFPNYVI